MIISTEQVINRTKIRLGIKNTEYDAAIEKLVDEGCAHLGAKRTRVFSCATIQLDCYRGTLPDFFTEFVAATFPSGGCTCGCDSTSTDSSVTTSEALSGCSCPVWYVSDSVFRSDSTCGRWGNFFNIEGNQIVLPSTTTATEIKVYFKSMNVDSNGLMVIYENWERGLSAYAASEFAITHDTRYTPRQQGKWEATWKAQKGKQIGIDNINDFNLNSHEISRIMNSIITNTAIQGIYY